MASLLETIIFVFGLVALGYLASLLGVLKTETGEALTAFAVTFAMPALLFRTMVDAHFGDAAPWALWISYFVGFGSVWLLGHLMLWRLFNQDPRTSMVGGLAGSFSNLVLLGIPLTLGIYGQDGFEVLSLIISIHLPIMMGASILLYELMGARGGTGIGFGAIAGEFARKLFLNPLIIGILLGLGWRLTGLPLPGLATRFVDAFANVASTVALFAMGLGLRRFGISGAFKPVLGLAMLKLMAMPGIVLLVAWAVDLPPASATIAVLGASMPAGVNPYLVATRFGTGQRLTSNAMTVGTALAVLTVTFWLYAADLLLR